eukprot:12959684-Alexandrium_andersonii.AAC.1
MQRNVSSSCRVAVCSVVGFGAHTARAGPQSTHARVRAPKYVCLRACAAGCTRGRQMTPPLAGIRVPICWGSVEAYAGLVGDLAWGLARSICGFARARCAGLSRACVEHVR